MDTALTHVYWLGGAPDTGKTSIATALAERHGCRVYRLDPAEQSHIARSSPERQPEYLAFVAMSMDERWVSRSPAEMARQIVQIGAERFPLVLEDLRAMPADQPVVAEGPWLFPECVAPLLAGPRRAIWLVPSEDFKRASALRRDKPRIRYDTGDPERAARNWFERDRLIAEHVREETLARGLALVEVDGSRSLEEMVALVARHFGLLHS